MEDFIDCELPESFCTFINELCDGDYDNVVYRIFWLLQYYFAYYGFKALLRLASINCHAACELGNTYLLGKRFGIDDGNF